MKGYLKKLLWVGIGCAALGGMGVFAYCSLFECKIGELVIKSYEDCVAQGFPVENADPPKCIVSKEKVFVKPPQNIRPASPKAGDLVESPFNITGEALALNNTVYYRLLGEDQSSLAEGSAMTDSPEHGSLGSFAIPVTFDRRHLTSGTLEIFERDPRDKELNTVKIPVRFTEQQNPSTSFEPLRAAPQEVPAQAHLLVPFTPQAPFADWSDTYNEACEEAALIMVEYMLRDKPLTDNLANAEIITLIDWEKQNGYDVDVTAEDLGTIARTHFKRLAKAYEGADVTEENIKRLIAAGHPVIIPAAGKMLKNPYFRGDGPPYHMLVITGYDEQGFLAHDPGTRRGKDYRYSYDTIMSAIHDWTGSKSTINSGKKAMLVVGK